MSILRQVEIDNPEMTKAFASRLSCFRGSNAVIVCTRAHLMTLAERIGGILQLPLDIVACMPIADPANASKCIGSVSIDDVVLGHLPFDLPQDYLSHQIGMIRFCLRKESEAFPLLHLRYLWNKEVILLCDFVESSDSIMAAITSVSRMIPLRITVACVSMNATASRVLSRVVDEMICLTDPSVVNDQFVVLN